MAESILNRLMQGSMVTGMRFYTPQLLLEGPQDIRQEAYINLASEWAVYASLPDPLPSEFEEQSQEEDEAKILSLRGEEVSRMEILSPWPHLVAHFKSGKVHAAYHWRYKLKESIVVNAKFLIFILLSATCVNVHAGIFKCVNEKNETIYQQQPCNVNDKVSEELNINSENNSGPVEMTSENKRLYKLAHYSDVAKFTASECNRRNSSYSQEIQQAADRLFEIRKSEVEAGNEILNRGFKGLPPSEIASLRSKGKRELIAKMSKMSMDELDRHCDSQARRARGVAAMSKNRDSGYVEGDLDPEGND